MKYIILSVIALAAVLILFACTTRKKTPNTTDISEKVPLISFTKGSCRGKCKVFSLTVFEDKTIQFEGVRNVEHIGKFQGKLSENQYKDLVSYFKTNDFETLEDDYQLAVKDLQKIEISYQGKMVKFHKRNAPDTLVSTMSKLDELVNQVDWTKM